MKPPHLSECGVGPTFPPPPPPYAKNLKVKVSVQDRTNLPRRTTNQKSTDMVEVCLCYTDTQYTCALPYDRNAFQGPHKLLF